MTKINVTLKTANQRAAGNGTMTICDALVDGDENTVIFWDAAQPDKLTPGAQMEVVFDGNAAKWDERNGRRSFQVRPKAQVVYLGAGEPPATQATPPPQATQAPQSSGKKTREEVLRQAVEDAGFVYELCVNHGLPAQIAEGLAIASPHFYPINWFGEK